MKILSDKSVASRENESLRGYARAYDDLRAENDRLRRALGDRDRDRDRALGDRDRDRTLGDRNRDKSDPPKSPALSTSSKGSSTSSTDPTANADRSSPDGQEFEEETTSSSASGHACR